MEVVQLQGRLIDFTSSLFREGFLNDQYTQLQQLQDESNPDFVVELVEWIFLTLCAQRIVGGVKLSEASKKLGPKFATGASVVKGPTEKEHIDIQGDIAYDIVEFITDSWPDVPETAIFFIEDGKKVPAA